MSKSRAKAKSKKGAIVANPKAKEPEVPSAPIHLQKNMIEHKIPPEILAKIFNNLDVNSALCLALSCPMLFHFWEQTYRALIPIPLSTFIPPSEGGPTILEAMLCNWKGLGRAAVGAMTYNCFTNTFMDEEAYGGATEERLEEYQGLEKRREARREARAEKDQMREQRAREKKEKRIWAREARRGGSDDDDEEDEDEDTSADDTHDETEEDESEEHDGY